MKRITIITGHYGSGKSEVATNLAIQKHVDAIIDLDIVNPYFRSRELEIEFKSHNIKLISSTIANALGSDLPYISPQVFEPFINKNIKAIYDLGGDGVGARLLRQFSDYLDNDIDLLCCINIFREETSSVTKILKMINILESGGGVKITGLINNTNLLRDTSLEDIKNGERIIKEVAELTKLPIVYTSVGNYLDTTGTLFAGEKLEIELYLRKKWL